MGTQLQRYPLIRNPGMNDHVTWRMFIVRCSRAELLISKISGEYPAEKQKLIDGCIR